MPITHSVFKQTVLNVSAQYPPVAATHDQNPLQNDTIALSTTNYDTICPVTLAIYRH